MVAERCFSPDRRASNCAHYTLSVFGVLLLKTLQLRRRPRRHHNHRYTAEQSIKSCGYQHQVTLYMDIMLCTRSSLSGASIDGYDSATSRTIVSITRSLFLPLVTCFVNIDSVRHIYRYYNQRTRKRYLVCIQQTAKKSTTKWNTTRSFLLNS